MTSCCSLLEAQLLIKHECVFLVSYFDSCWCSIGKQGSVIGKPCQSSDFSIGLIFLGLVVLVLQKPVPGGSSITTGTSNSRYRTHRCLSKRLKVQKFNLASLSLRLYLLPGRAGAVVERWLTVKSQIFAPPFDTGLADQVVAWSFGEISPRLMARFSGLEITTATTHTTGLR